jgi:hypothetical protein
MGEKVRLRRLIETHPQESRLRSYRRLPHGGRWSGLSWHLRVAACSSHVPAHAAPVQSLLRV